MSADRKVIETDVLVVGSAGAGSRAAIEVARNSLKVLVAAKGILTKSGATVAARMDVNLPSRDAKEVFSLNGDMADTVDSFAQDMLQEGKYMNNEEVVFAHCSNATKYIEELVSWGMRIDGLTQSPGHRFPRGILSDGRSMMSALKRGTRDYKIDFNEHIMITDLLKKNGRVVGAVGIDIKTGDFLVFKAKAVILASGGASRLYPITTAAEELTGDGIYMAYEAGAELVDMEYPLFLPACIYWPESLKGIIFPYVFGSEVGGWWLNRFGERFIEKWDPVRMERGTTRDVASIAQATEIIEGRGGPHGGIFVSFKHIPDEILRYHAEQAVWCRDFVYGQLDLAEFSMDPRKVAYEAGPAAHYWNGGAKVNGNGETNVPGLYAAGEVQGGTQGANRLSGNGVTECLVFGAIAGNNAANYAKGAPPTEVDEEQLDMYHERVYKPLTRNDGFDVLETRRKIQNLASKYVGPVREESGLTACIEKIGEMNKEVLPNMATKAKGRVYNREWVAALENEALLRVLEIIARASLMRKESRGAMYRIDYPDTDNKDWLRNIIVKNKDGQISLEIKPVATTRISLPEREKIPYMVSDWKFDKKS